MYNLRSLRKYEYTKSKFPSVFVYVGDCDGSKCALLLLFAVAITIAVLCLFLLHLFGSFHSFDSFTSSIISCECASAACYSLVSIFALFAFKMQVSANFSFIQIIPSFLIHKELTLSLPLSLSLKNFPNLNWYNTVDSATVEQKIILKSFQSMSMFAKSITRMNWIWNDWVANFDFNEKELDLIL